jgi:protein disulfide-isomerase A1
MRLLPASALATAALALLFGGAALADDAKDSAVLVLTGENFPSVVKDRPLVMVKFYAPWCGHCKALAPEYEEAASTLKASHPDITLAKVDCTVEKDLCQEHDVNGYPTVKVFKDGKPKDYEGPRKADGIMSYLKKRLLPPVSDVKHDQLDTFKASDRLVLIGYFASDKDAGHDAFHAVAKELSEDLVFGQAMDPESHKAHDVAPPALVLHRSFDEPRIVYTGKIDDTEAIKEFIGKNKMPLLDEVGPENFMKYMESGLPLAYLFLDDDDTRKSLPEEIKPVAREFQGKVNFVWIDAVKYSGHSENLNLKQTWPAFAIQEPQAQTKFPFDQSTKITTESIREFVTKYVAGEIKPSIKSEPVPEKNDAPVKVVVADEFDKIVMDKEKDVLIEFYAPWCGHCKNLAPTYDEVGKRFEAFSDRVVIAKMDATANDVPPTAGFSVSGFPTIKLIKAGTNEVVDYDGDRTAESFYKFMAEKSTHKVDVNAEDLKKVEEDVKKEEEEAKKDEEKKEDAKHDEL